VKAMSKLRRLVPLLIGAAPGCGEGPAELRGGPIQVLSADGGSDTALALVASPLVVKVLDDQRRPLAGVGVHFLALPPASADEETARRGMYVCPLSQSQCVTWWGEDNHSVIVGADVMTDDAGIARARVQHGVLAGPASIEVSVADVGVRLIHFTTRPASLAQVVATVADTAVYVGSSYALGARAADRFGNTRPDVVTVRAATPEVATVAAGRVNAVAIGRGRIVMEAGTVNGTAFVSVPPRGRLAALGDVVENSVSGQRLTLVNTDGSARRVVLVTPGDNGNANPVWTPNGGRLVFQESLDGYSHALQLADTLGNRSPFLEGVARSFQPVFSAGGTGLYFYGSEAELPDGTDGIYRANADGTEPRYLFPGVQPGPSPDGSRVAYVVSGSDGLLAVRDMATGTTTEVASSVTFPRWSPTGELIAFVTDGGAGDVQVVRADGTNRRTVAPGLHQPIVSWSPDGAWLVAAPYSGVGLELIRVADGLVIPIPGTKDLSQPAWRP
jgi:Tol biopolymer transport system component